MAEIPDWVYGAARSAYDGVVIVHGAWGRRAGHHDAILAVVDAVRPYLVAEGRRQAAEAVRQVEVVGSPEQRDRSQRLRDWYAGIAEGVDG